MGHGYEDADTCPECWGNRAVPSLTGDLEPCSRCVVDAGLTYIIWEGTPTFNGLLWGDGGQSSDAECGSWADTVADEDSGPHVGDEIVAVRCERCIAETASWLVPYDQVPASVEEHVARFHPYNGVGPCRPSGEPIWIGGEDWWIVEDDET